MSFFKNKTRVEKDPSDKDIVKVPSESDSFFKRLSSPSYVLIHPELFWKSAFVIFISSLIQMWICVFVVQYVVIEIVNFIYMITNYGWLR